MSEGYDVNIFLDRNCKGIGVRDNRNGIYVTFPTCDSVPSYVSSLKPSKKVMASHNIGLDNVAYITAKLKEAGISVERTD